MAVQRHLSVSAKATNGGGAAAAKAGGSAQTTDIGTVSYTTSGTTRVFKLERPKQLNALDEPMMASMTEAAKVGAHISAIKREEQIGTER